MRWLGSARRYTSTGEAAPAGRKLAHVILCKRGLDGWSGCNAVHLEVVPWRRVRISTVMQIDVTEDLQESVFW